MTIKEAQNRRVYLQSVLQYLLDISHICLKKRTAKHYRVMLTVTGKEGQATQLQLQVKSHIDYNFIKQLQIDEINASGRSSNFPKNPQQKRKYQYAVSYVCQVASELHVIFNDQ